ncbi:hypothetical protein D8M05_14970 [Oceanobacillus bengalensis]|uniref:Uncharacterized protein n=1 Tax=Oceanobacillus bengalensis TaxID=1435466 RepID=A0A494YUI8_9BACI|nr:hypothetical protein D8M05_14970 [Oceanobacillus bengalensis]
MPTPEPMPVFSRPSLQLESMPALSYGGEGSLASRWALEQDIRKRKAPLESPRVLHIQKK